MSGAALVLLTVLLATPTFLSGQTVEIPFGSPVFAVQWNGGEMTVPNFWGPAYQVALNEPYQEATGGNRLVQYFDKARMEQTASNGAVTNGLLTVELVTGKRQMGDATFVTFAPSTLPIVGDLDNTWPTYAAISGSVFAPRVARGGESVGTVYKSDGTFGVNPGLAAYPGAAAGTYQVDPGGRYAHNVPLAFTAFLAALPSPPLPAMGLPLTEPFWVNVAVNTAPTWVMVQPFERRVLSYTPTNPPKFQVEMGNIGRHYFDWRYAANPGGGQNTVPPVPCPTITANPTGTGTGTGTATRTPTTTATATATPVSCVSATPPPCPTATAISTATRMPITTTSTTTAIPTATATATPTIACAPCPTAAVGATVTPRATTRTPTSTATATATMTPAACATVTTAVGVTGTGAPGALAISAVQLGTVTDTEFSLTFKTNVAATSEILYGTSSHSYESRQDVATTATQEHTISLTNLKPGTKYYFTLRAVTADASIQRKEDYFSTAPTTGTPVTGGAATATKTPKPPTETIATVGVATKTSTSTATTVATGVATATATTKPTATATATATTIVIPTATATTKATATATATPTPMNVRVTLTQVTVTANNVAQLAPAVLQTDSATVALSLAYDGPSGSTAATAHPTNWTLDATNATASSTTPGPPLTLIDKGAAVIITATATIPFTDSSSPPIVVSWTRKIAVSEYAAGATITSPALNNAKSPSYSVTLTFSTALG